MPEARTAPTSAPTFSLGAGVCLRPLALRRGATSGDDALVALRHSSTAADGTALELQRTAPGVWTASGGGCEQRALELRVSDEELAGLLIPPVDEARGTSAHPRGYVPSWPDNLVDALCPWPLKGRGTIVFDHGFFLEHLDSLLEPGNGPVMLLGGAAKLGLSSERAVEALREALPGVNGRLAPLFLGTNPDLVAGTEEPPRYADLLAASAAVRSGLVDLTRSRAAAEGRRSVRLEDWPFGFEHVPRTWAHGAVMRELEPGGTAECAGCCPGDVIVSANNRAVFDASLSEVSSALRASAQLVMEVEQPVLDCPLYLREASSDVLLELAGPAAVQGASDAIPRLTALLEKSSGGQGFRQVQPQPKVFAGDGGSASRLHADNVPRAQFCHVLHGVKLFAVEHDSAAAAELSGMPEEAEVAFPADLPLDAARAAWLASPGVSFAAIRPGDVCCFWGGDRHCGINAMSAGPCVALFHGYHWERHGGVAD